MGKAILALCRQAPYGDMLAREGLEAVFAIAAMEQNPQLLFLNDGVFQLLDDQDAKVIGQKSFRRNLAALPMFGVDNFYVCRQSFNERELNLGQICLPGIKFELVENVGSFIAGFDMVLSF